MPRLCVLRNGFQLPEVKLLRRVFPSFERVLVADLVVVPVGDGAPDEMPDELPDSVEMEPLLLWLIAIGWGGGGKKKK